MSNNFQTALVRISFIVFIFASVCCTAAGQQPAVSSDLFDLKDFGEFRLPSSLRPLFEPQIERGPINHVDVGKFENRAPVFSAASSKIGRLRGSTPNYALVEIDIDPCVDQVCQDLTDSVDLENAQIKRDLEELKAVVTKMIKDDGDSVVEWRDAELKPIGGRTAICVTVRTRYGDGGAGISIAYFIYNHDLRYSIQTSFPEKDREFWGPQMTRFLESINIRDRAPSK